MAGARAMLDLLVHARRQERPLRVDASPRHLELSPLGGGGVLRNRRERERLIPTRPPEPRLRARQGEDAPVRCLKDGIWLLEQGKTRFAVFLEPAVVSQEELENAARAVPPALPVKGRKKNFNEVERSLSEEQARAEARRCLRCDLAFTQNGQPACALRATVGEKSA